MGKKNFSGGLQSLLQATTEEEEILEEGSVSNRQSKSQKKGRPQTSTRVITKASQEGTLEGETRATFIVNEETLETVKSLAYWERKKLKSVVQEALEGYIKQREERHIKQAEKAYKERS